MTRMLAIIFIVFGIPALAVEPDEILQDPALEARARALSKELRCLVCRNESIDESNAELARDLRILVRERILEGDTNDEAKEFIVARYGEYVLLNPAKSGSSLILWWIGPVSLFLAASLSLHYLRRRRTQSEASPLSDEEKSRLKNLLDK